MEGELGHAKRMSARLQAQLMDAAMRGEDTGAGGAGAARSEGGKESAREGKDAASERGEQDSTGRSEAHQLRKVS